VTQSNGQTLQLVKQRYIIAAFLQLHVAQPTVCPDLFPGSRRSLEFARSIHAERDSYCGSSITATLKQTRDSATATWHIHGLMY